MVYDNVCKYLAEEYPRDFVRWLLNIESVNVEVLKTELKTEPLRADSLILLQVGNKILHSEFQTLPDYDNPMPFRMLRYWVRLQEKYPSAEIEQVVIFLKPTTSEQVFENSYSKPNLNFHYRVIRLWEQPPDLFLATPGLLPLAPLTRTEEPRVLLEQVASQIDRVESRSQQRELIACTDFLAGLKFDRDFIRQILREDIMRESVTYQDILQKGQKQGERIGLQLGLQQGKLELVMRQLTRRFGRIPREQEDKMNQLSTVQIEDLAEALLDFQSMSDLVCWLDNNS
jgi:predicted transposase/invertase (TIGR01784 family)